MSSQAVTESKTYYCPAGTTPWFVIEVDGREWGAEPNISSAVAKRDGLLALDHSLGLVRIVRETPR